MGRRVLLLAVAFGLALFVAWSVFSRPVHPPKTSAQRIANRIASPEPAATRASVSASSPAAGPPNVPSSPQASGQFDVAIIIDDCGQWLDTERGFLDLPIPLTMSVLPHVRYTAQIAQEAAAAGKGVILHLPMEPLGRDTAGRGEITTAMSDDQVIAQTEDDVAQVPGAAGVNNHEGSKASADSRIMGDVIGVIKAHGLFFIDSRTNANSVGAQTASDAGVPEASRNVFLDDKADQAETERMLERTVDIARRNGSAIAIGHPKPTTLAALRNSFAKMQAEGARFVLASSLTR